MSNGLSGSFLHSSLNGSHSCPFPVFTMTRLTALSINNINSVFFDSLITSRRGYAAEQLVPSDGATCGEGGGKKVLQEPIRRALLFRIFSKIF